MKKGPAARHDRALERDYNRSQNTKHMKGLQPVTPNDQRTLIGQFTLDPKTADFKELQSVCEKGNPWRCLIGTAASIHLGKRMTVRVDHENQTGVIGITEGDYRWERPMTASELRFATRFDLSKPLTKPLAVKVDLRDPAWTAKPKQHSTPAKNKKRTQGQRTVKTIRARQLEAIRKAHAEAATS
jgi:hypothetical protein